jgi:hypothetical protein
MLSFIKRLLGSTQRPAAHKCGFRPTLEALEERVVLSFNWNAGTHVLTVRGDQNGAFHDDKFVLAKRADNPAVDQIVHYSDGRGVDSYDIPYSTSYDTEVDIDGGFKTDTVAVGTLSHGSHYEIYATNPEIVTVSNVKIGTFIFITSTTTNSSTALTLDGSSDTAGRWLVLASDSLQSLAPSNDPDIPAPEFLIGFGNAHIGSLVINTGSGNDSVRVNATPIATTINTGGGNDNVYVGGRPGGQSMSSYFNGDLAGLTGTLTVDGGSVGQDQLFISDGGSTLNAYYVISASYYSRASHPVSIEYSGFEAATFDTGGTGSNVNINSTAAGVPTLLQTSSAVPVWVGNLARRLDDFRGALNVLAVNTSGTTIAGGALTIDDHLSTAAHNYTITRNGSVTVAREDGVSIVSSSMSGVSLNTGSGADTFTIVDTNNQAIPTSVSIDGGGSSGGDTLIQQPTWSVSFVINGINKGTAFGVAFNSVENLKAGSADDAFVFQTGGGLGGTIDGGGGINTLDYSALTSGVTVDLALRVATGVANNAANGIANIRNVIGSKGDDLLRGDANANYLLGVDGNDILIGLDGDDTLKARGGIANVGTATTRRCILVGGNGIDDLEGSEGEDILLGGYFENNLDLNDNVLRAFMNVWKGTDSYANRTYALNHNGVSVNVNGTTSTYKINDSSTHIDDNAADTVNGKGGTDWFWTDGDNTDHQSGEEIRDV